MTVVNHMVECAKGNGWRHWKSLEIKTWSNIEHGWTQKMGMSICHSSQQGTCTKSNQPFNLTSSLWNVHHIPCCPVPHVLVCSWPCWASISATNTASCHHKNEWGKIFKQWCHFQCVTCQHRFKLSVLSPALCVKPQFCFSTLSDCVMSRRLHQKIRRGVAPAKHVSLRGVLMDPNMQIEWWAAMHAFLAHRKVWLTLIHHHAVASCLNQRSFSLFSSFPFLSLSLLSPSLSEI